MSAPIILSGWSGMEMEHVGIECGWNRDGIGMEVPSYHALRAHIALGAYIRQRTGLKYPWTTGVGGRGYDIMGVLL